jgi:hypothetical protein
MNWLWRMVNDQYGRDPCVKIPGSSIVIFPVTMISKRIEHGEEVDVFDLFNRVVAQAQDRRKPPIRFWTDQPELAQALVV